MGVVFEAVTSRKVYMKVVDQVLEFVKSGALKLGDKLPSESVIAEQLGVSRPTVREALSALELIGVVETRIGQGTYICQVDLQNLQSRAASLQQEERSPYEILETRIAIEPIAASLAAQRAGPEDVAEAEKALVALSDGVRTHHGWNADADRQFHLVVARATGNSVLADVMALLLNMTREKWWDKFRDRVHATPGLSERWLEQHRAILVAIREHDAQRAQAATLGHLAEAKHAMFDE